MVRRTNKWTEVLNCLQWNVDDHNFCEDGGGSHIKNFKIVKYLGKYDLINFLLSEFGSRIISSSVI